MVTYPTLPIAIGMALLLASCGGSAPTARQGTVIVACSTSLHCLPDSRREREQRSFRMRRGWVLAEHAFHMPPPPRPQDLDDFWLALGEWLSHREDAVEAARDELEVAARENFRQQIVAHAILGLIYEDVARELQAIELPPALGDAATLGRAYLEPLSERARPFLAQAQAAYRDCAQTALGPPDMREWSRFCEMRHQDLPSGAWTIEPDLGSDKTTVEMTIE